LIKESQRLHSLRYPQRKIYVPLQWLYGHQAYWNTLTGPVIIHKANVNEWITFLQGAIGLDNFQKQIPW
jgi:hypothetical protein